MFRLDRVASVYFGGPIARARRTDRLRIPILMYHSVSDKLFGKSHPYFEINTRPKVFAQQMEQLHSSGYRTVTLEDVVNGSMRSNEKCVAITFDDGYRDFYETALPVLLQFGMTATMFVATGRIHDKPTKFEGVEYLSWSDVREMRTCGMQIGSHTVTHPELAMLSRNQIDRELRDSKDAIEQQLNATVTSFAYPYGFPEVDDQFIHDAREVLQSCGYEVAVTTILGTATISSDRYLLPRLPVNSWDDRQFLKTKLDGGYDWLHLPQLWSKKARKATSGASRSYSPRGTRESATPIRSGGRGI
jgi:peptidoglycan/xylan/chitin deacetylase (PgdA/CDA1 family)